MVNNFWWWVIVIALGFTTFLVMLNGFLRGRWKGYLDAALGLIWLLLLVLSLILFGWFIALCHLIGSFMFGALIRPVAGFFASYLLKH